jgi:four helix bundle protein
MPYRTIEHFDMTNTRSHKDLLAWQKARRLVISLYRASATFPSCEQFGLALQCRRAGVSVLTNISEGAARGSDREFRQFLYIARGSLAELEAQTLVASDLGYVGIDDVLHANIAEVGRLINGLVTATQNAMSSPANT